MMFGKNDVQNDVRKAVEATEWNPIATIGSWGVRSGHAYTAGFVAIGLSMVTWLVSRGKKDGRPQSDRRGLFVGQWVPALFALGVALKNEEK